MAKTYDAVTKYLVETRPEDWVSWLGLTATGVRLVDTDLSTVTAESDRVILLEGPRPSLLHIEFQAGHDPKLPLRLLRYHALLLEKFDLPVVTVVILLKRAAYRRIVSGRLRVETELPDAFIDFGYRTVKVWEISAGDLLGGELSLLPLIPLTGTPLVDIPRTIHVARERLTAELEPETAREMLTAMGILLGVRYSDRKIVERLLREVRGMKESTTYQMILEEGIEQGIEQGIERGRLREARQILLRMGRKRLGEPTAETLASLEAVDSVEGVERLVERTVEVETWADLLDA